MIYDVAACKVEGARKKVAIACRPCKRQKRSVNEIPKGTMVLQIAVHIKTTSLYFFPVSIASPFLHATILIFCAETISLDSILNEGFFTMNVQTSSQRRYVCR